MLGWANSFFARSEPSAEASPAPPAVAAAIGVAAKATPDAASAAGRLAKYDPVGDVFEPVLDVARVLIRADEAGGFRYAFVVLDQAGAIQVSQTLDHGMQLQFNKAKHSMVWMLPLGDILDDEMVTLSFTFVNEGEEHAFKVLCATKLYEASRGESFAKTVKPADANWVLSARDDYDSDAPPVDDPMEFSDSDEEAPASPSARVMVTPPRNNGGRQRASIDEKNSQLVCGMGIDRSYVVRGSNVGVFKHGRDRMELTGTIDKVRGMDGALFSPSKVMLHDRDRKMLMLRPDDEHTVVELDLETQQVVQEYNAHEDMKIRDLGPTSRFSQLEGTDMIVGMNRNSMFSMDPRLHTKNKKVDGYSYTANPHLSCVTATATGQYALGSDKGEIRMFSGMGKRAKTLLPGLGHAITGIDTTSDGKWVLATTERYLMLVPTELENGRTGFDVSMGKNTKPTPFKLQLKPQDLVKHGIRVVCFRPAHFDIGDGVEEQWIVSAIRNLVITWSMKAIKQGRLYDYTIKVCEENVVADQFRFGHSEDVVVALPDDVKSARFRSAAKRRTK